MGVGEVAQSLSMFVTLEAGKMVQWLRALVALQRTQVQFPAPTQQLTTVCNSQF